MGNLRELVRQVPSRSSACVLRSLFRASRKEHLNSLTFEEFLVHSVVGQVMVAAAATAVVLVFAVGPVEFDCSESGANARKDPFFSDSI